MPISDAEIAELEAEFEERLDDYMGEWEKSLQSHFAKPASSFAEHDVSGEARDADGKWTAGANAEKHVDNWLSRAAKVPANVYEAAKSKVKKHYGKLETRYGRKTALAIITAGILAFPLPGGTIIGPAPIIAVAELIRHLRGAKVETMAEEAELSEEEIERLGKEFIEAILAEDEPEPPA